MDSCLPRRPSPGSIKYSASKDGKVTEKISHISEKLTHQGQAIKMEHVRGLIVEKIIFEECKIWQRLNVNWPKL
jgi:hypothetical protein